jgi:hypothetical protein
MNRRTRGLVHPLALIPIREQSKQEGPHGLPCFFLLAFWESMKDKPEKSQSGTCFTLFRFSPRPDACVADWRQVTSASRE